MRARRSGALLCVLFVLSTFVVASPAGAATCKSSDLVPQVRGFSINQGLGSYKDLVRGRDILFRLFLSEPACADGTDSDGKPQWVALTSATLKVNAGAVTLLSVQNPTNSLNPAPQLVPHKDAPAVGDSTGDPKWFVSGSALAAAAPAAPAPLTFEATVTYANSAGGTGTTGPINTFGGKSMQKTLLGPTSPSRVLAIPLGDASKTVSSQFGTSARTATLDGFSTLGRIFPVAGGTLDLTDADLSATAGMRYHLNTNTQVDVTSYMNSDGIFCDDGSAMKSVIAPQLLDNLKQYNTANPLSKSADNVMGVVDQAISFSGCMEGYALVNSDVSFVRARYKTSDTDSKNPVMTGALMGMEQAHNLGAVPVDRDGAGDRFHSQNTFAHSVDPADSPDVAYNLLLLTATSQPVVDDKNVMQFSAQDPGTWLNSNTFLQKEDWALVLCKFGGPSTDDCEMPLDGSAAAGVAAQPTTTIVGTTDGTKEGTEVFDSFAETPGAVDVARESFIHLVQKDVNGKIVADQPVRLTDDGGHHHGDGVVETHTKVFSVSYATDPDAASLELVNTTTGEVLYHRSKSGGGPRNVRTTVSRTGSTPGGCTSDCPAPVAMTSEAEFGDTAEKIDFERNPLTDEAYEAGDTVTTEYLLSKGIVFNDDPTTTPKIIGDCLQGDSPCRFPPGTPTKSGRFALWNSPDTLPVGPVDPVPDSGGIPLNVDFVDAVQKVGLYMGNDDTNSTTATLTAFDAAGDEIESVTKRDFGSAISTFIGIDAGRANIFSIELDYGDSPLGEEIDDLIFERPAGGTPTNTYRATVTAEDDDPSNMRAAFFAKCTKSNEILVSGVHPDSVEDQEGTFHYDFDATQICRVGSTTTILVRFNDGYNQTSFYEMPVNAAPADPPLAIIDNPAADAHAYNVLQHEPITLTGQGWDEQEGVLPGDKLTWTVTGPTGVVSSGEKGNNLILEPPAGGSWTPGPYTAELTVENSAGLSNSTSTTFNVLEDKDNDGIPVTVEACFKGSDNDPNDAFGDFDKDGVVNQQDEDPCTPRASYEGQADFDPNTLNYPSTGGSLSVSVGVTLRYRDVSQIDGSTIRIERLGGRLVPANDPAFSATGWNVKTSGGVTVGTAKFDRQAIIDFLCPSPDECATDQTIWITITGDAPAGRGKPAYSFDATDAFQVQKS